MPDVSEGPETAAPDTPAVTPTEANPLPGFAEAMANYGNPAATNGEPPRAEAVDENEAADKTAKGGAEKAETPPAKPDAAPDAESAVNFDGFSEAQEATWQRLYKAGAVTKEEVERARLESMFQSAFSKKTLSLKQEREAFAEEMKGRKDDLALLDKIRGDDALHARWLRMQEPEATNGEAAADDLVDAKKAAEIADKRYDAREAEKAARTAKEQAAYDARKSSMREAIQEWMPLHKATAEQMREYLTAEEAALPVGVDPITHFKPEELLYRIGLRHEAAVAKAEAAALKQQLGQKTSHESRTSKQSFAPTRPAPTKVPTDPWSKAMAELNVAPDMSNVQGFGLPVRK